MSAVRLLLKADMVVGGFGADLILELGSLDSAYPVNEFGRFTAFKMEKSAVRTLISDSCRSESLGELSSMQCGSSSLGSESRSSSILVVNNEKERKGDSLAFFSVSAVWGS